MSGSTYTVTASDGFAFAAAAGDDLTSLEIQSRIRDMHTRIIAMSQSTDVFAATLQKLTADVSQLTTVDAGVQAIQAQYNALVAQNANDAAQLAQIETSFSGALPALNQAVTANTPAAGTGAQPVTTSTLAGGSTAGAGAAVDTSGSSGSGQAAAGAGGASTANFGTGATTDASGTGLTGSASTAATGA